MTSGRERTAFAHVRYCLVALIAVVVSSSPPSADAAVDGSYQDVFWVNSCAAYGANAPAWTPANSGVGLTAADSCAGGDGLVINGSHPFQGSSSKWTAETPSSAMRIIGISTPNTSEGNPRADCKLGSDGYTAAYFWGDNGTNYGTKPITVDCHSDGNLTGTGTGIGQKIKSSRYFGFAATCTNGTASSGELQPRCAVSSGGVILDVTGISLEVQETSGPTMNAAGANNLWNQNGWVRGSWSTDLAASDPSGVCGMQTAVNGTPLNTYDDSTPNQASWSQCPGSVLNSNVDTSKYPNGHGTLTLAFSASNAAGALAYSSKAVSVDNAPVGLNLSGPTDAPSTAGTQYVTATATAGPSGVAGIWCSVNGSPFAKQAGASARIPVQGIGGHTVQCYARNNAADAAGDTAVSPTATWSLSIRQPSVSSVSFTRLVDSLRCRRSREQVTVPAHWVTGHAHGKKVRVKLPAQTRTVKVVHCHPRIVKKKVKVGKHRYVERVVVRPHKVSAATKRVGFGKRTVVAGWLGTADGNALGGQTVRIFTAPDNGSNAFTQVAVAQTAANGSWTAKLPPGPSRVVQARFDGSATVEPAVGIAHVRVPASIKLAISPTRSHWGGTITIHGRLRGCCVPAAGELVELHVGWRGGSTEIGHVYASGDGSFHTIYTFLRGSGTQTYRFWATSADESDYPYAPHASRKVFVTVG
jgi:hypothetical protein